MLAYQLELEGCSIVVLGSFNPSIFHPVWFSANELIRKEDETSAKIQIIHPEVSSFTTEWFHMQVTDGNFTLETNDPTTAPVLRDLARGTFKLLEHTPLSAFGFNSHRHYRMSSDEEWHAFGHHFAPKESWQPLLLKPGMLGLVMQGEREHCSATIQVRIEPSARVHPGVFISINEHYNLEKELGKDAGQMDRNRLFLKTLGDSWEAFFNYTSKVAEHLFTEVSLARGQARRKKKR
jgi:hypothetical protein